MISLRFRKILLLACTLRVCLADWTRVCIVYARECILAWRPFWHLNSCFTSLQIITASLCAILSGYSIAHYHYAISWGLRNAPNVGKEIFVAYSHFVADIHPQSRCAILGDARREWVELRVKSFMISSYRWATIIYCYFVVIYFII